MTIAYLSNSYPEACEPYVGEEIRELRRHGIQVLACSSRRVQATLTSSANTILPLRLRPCIRAVWLSLIHVLILWEFIARALRGPEPVSRRVRCLVHTWLGVYFAVLLRDKRIRHIHVHHGYFSAWIGMVAARLLHADFSLTLHGSDLLLGAAYLDTKLKHCRFCVTVSHYNRQYLLSTYPNVAPDKIVVQRLGVDPGLWRRPKESSLASKPFSIVSVGRLHPVKNHAFLILACRALKSSGIEFMCSIAGDGAQRAPLANLISDLGLEREISLLGHVPREQLPALYAQADVVVLTSKSEGVPITLMEAMSMKQVVLAPDITGIPELVVDGKTGFLYSHNSMEHFLLQLHRIFRARTSLDSVRQSARNQVLRYFNGPVNLQDFASEFLSRTHLPTFLNQLPAGIPREDLHEDPVLQQV